MNAVRDDWVRQRERKRDDRMFGLRLFAFGLFVVVTVLVIVSTWFEGAVVDGIARVLYVIPEALGWIIDAL